MKDTAKTKEQLINELAELRQRIARLEASEADLKRASQEWSRLFHEHSPLPYQSLDENGHFLTVNQAWLDLLGYSPSEVIGKWFGDFLAPQYVDKFKENFPRFKAAGKITGIEFELVKKDGKRVQVAFNGTIACDEQGRFKQTHCLMYDLTEHKQMYEKLLESEQKYSALFQKSGVIVAVTKLPSSIIVDVNEAFEKTFGYTKQEVVGKTSVELGINPDAEGRASLLSNLEEQGSLIGMEFTLLTKSGSPRLFLGNINIVEIGGEKYAIQTAQDITEHRRVEEKLAESEAKYRSLVENAQQGIAVAQDGKVKFTNTKMAQMAGYTNEEILAKDPADIIYPDDYPLVMDYMRRRLSGEDVPTTYQFRIIDKAGSIKWLERTVATTIWDKRPAIIALDSDITEHKRLEEYLEKERQEFKLIIESSPIIIFYKDKEGRLVRVNKAFAEALKMPEDEFVGKTVFDLYSTEIAQGMTNDDQEVLKSGRPKLNIIEQYESASGLRWVQTDKIPIFDENGTAVGLVGFAQDITQHRKAESALVASEAKYRSLAETAGAGIATIDLEGKFTFVNEALIKMVGYSHDELLGKPFIDFVCPNDRTLIWDAFLAGVANPELQPVLEFRVTHKDGHDVWMYSSPTPMFIKGEVVGGNAIVIDISERRRAQEELQKSREQLRLLATSLQNARETERKAIAGDIHDDLGQALTALQIDTSWLLKKIPAKYEPLRRKAESMLEVIKATDEKVKQISAELRPSVLDDLGLVAAIEWQMAEFKKRTAIEFKLSLDPDIILDTEGSTALFRILQEALTNITRHAGASLVKVSLKKRADTIVIS